MANDNSNTPAKMPLSVQLANAKVTYQALGKDVTLTADAVRNYLVKGDGNVTDQEIMHFISICKFQELNPFLNEAYLVKFANNRGGEDVAQIIVSKEAFMKRAEGCENYEGIRAGVIVKRDSEVLELEGSFILESDVLLGGWAEVHRSDRKFPYVAKVSLKEYNKGRSTWNAIPCTMIRKVAEVQALREAFPTQLGALYTYDESNITDIDYEDVSKKTEGKANSKTLPDNKPSGTETQEQKPAAQPAGNQPQPGEMPDVFAQ